MPLMAIVVVNMTASVIKPTSAVTVLMAPLSITKLDHRSIELTDHTHRGTKIRWTDKSLAAKFGNR